ncbi:hypothetical protein [Fischerella sp. PCC 9605]|uniref:hypothetical protein n=1 Tax=Fischerella sp. PCC 9605 TaxID=1173024 RepID=UPI0018CC078F|nr:hypothetical protein [Fischerella sp. PCC 9605]
MKESLPLQMFSQKRKPLPLPLLRSLNLQSQFILVALSTEPPKSSKPSNNGIISTHKVPG